MTTDEAVIREVVQSWMTASKAGDTSKVLSLMADDVLFMVPGQEPFGKDAFAKRSAQMANVKIDGRADVLEVSVHGDMAWCRTHLEVTITPPAAEPVTRTGYALTIFKKSPVGDWQLFRDANLLAG